MLAREAASGRIDCRANRLFANIARSRRRDQLLKEQATGRSAVMGLFRARTV